MIDFFDVTLKLAFGFFILFLIVKLSGKTLIAQISPLDLMAVLILGELMGNALYDRQTSVFLMGYAFIFWGGLTLFLTFLARRYPWRRGLVLDVPAILINGGVVNLEELKRNKITIGQLQSLLRVKNIFSLREVEYAFLEPNGQISALTKPQYAMLKNKDMNIYVKPAYIPTTIIYNGQIIEERLKQICRDREWLSRELNAIGITDAGSVYFCEWLESDGLYVVLDSK